MVKCRGHSNKWINTLFRIIFVFVLSSAGVRDIFTKKLNFKNNFFLHCFSVFFFCLVLVYRQEYERLEPISWEDREVIYTKRLTQIQKVCRKYGLSFENVKKSRKKNKLKNDFIQLQSKYIGQFSKKVDNFWLGQELNQC